MTTPVLGIDLGTTNSTVSEIKWDPSMPTVPPAKVLEIEQVKLDSNVAGGAAVGGMVGLATGSGRGGKSRRKRAADTRIRIMAEEDAFTKVYASWRRQGYPFASLVPSLATAIGSSAAGPEHPPGPVRE